MSKELKPNYNILYDSALFTLRETYQRYKNAITEQLKWTFIDNEGRFSVLAGYEDRQEKINRLGQEVLRLQNELEKIKEKLE